MYEDLPKLWTRSFILLCLSAFFFFTAHHSVYSILSLYFHEQKLDRFISNQGLIIAAFTIASLLSRPFAGAICDGLYDSKNTGSFIILSGVVFSLSSLSYAFVSSSLYAMLAIRILHGVGMGFFYTSITVMLAKLVPPQRKAEAISHFGNSIKFAMFLGPPMGITLVTGGYFPFWVFVVSALLSLLAVIFIASSATKVNFSCPTRSEVGGRKMHKLFFTTSSLIPGITMGANSIAFGCLIPFAPLLAEQKGISDAAKWFYIFYGITLILSRALFGKLADRYSKLVTVVPGMLFVSISLLFIAKSDSVLLFILGSAMYGLASGVVQPALMAQSVEISRPNELGRAMATFSMLNDIGIAFGSFLMGTLAIRIGTTYSLLMVSFLVIVGLVFYVACGKRKDVLIPFLAQTLKRN